MRFHEMPDDYSDIIDLPHHVSKRHARMSMRNRAAQFAPFAALTGYDDAIGETARQKELASEEMWDDAEFFPQELS